MITDGTGLFETTVTPEPGEEGLWSDEADVPKQCTATTALEVVAAPATPTPTPTLTPVPTPSGELPNVAADEPRPPTARIQGAAFLAAAAIWLSRRRLARLVR